MSSRPGRLSRHRTLASQLLARRSHVAWRRPANLRLTLHSRREGLAAVAREMDHGR